MKAKSFVSIKEMEVYRKAHRLAMEVFRATQGFPGAEKYALTSQVRRSSRSVCLNLREAWAKRRYPAHFISKLTDCDGECCETDSALDFARDCGYLAADEHERLSELNREVGRMLGAMIRRSDSFIPDKGQSGRATADQEDRAAERQGPRTTERQSSRPAPP